MKKLNSILLLTLFLLLPALLLAQQRVVNMGNIGTSFVLHDTVAVDLTAADTSAAVYVGGAKFCSVYAHAIETTGSAHIKVTIQYAFETPSAVNWCVDNDQTELVLWADYTYVDPGTNGSTWKQIMPITTTQGIAWIRTIATGLGTNGGDIDFFMGGYRQP